MPAVSQGPLEGSSSLEQLGQALAAQTGVSKVTLEKNGNTTQFVGHINPEKPLAAADGGNPYGARLVGNNVTGDFADFGKAQAAGASGWSGYPPSTATPHPANAHFGMPNSSTVPRPSGEYTIVPGQGTMGAEKWTTAWRAELMRQRKVYTDGGMSPMDAQTKIASEDYKSWGLEWHRLYLVGWAGHHIHSIHWSGKDEEANLQYLQAAEHTPFNIWYDKIETEIAEYAKGIRK